LGADLDCWADTFQNSPGAYGSPLSLGPLAAAGWRGTMGATLPARRRVRLVALTVAGWERLMPRRSKTPGVRLIARKRADGVTWYGRWRDELTGKWQDENLTVQGLTTEALRRRWLQRKADELFAARRAMALGVVHTTYEEAAKRYLDDCRRRLRARSVAAYEYGVGVLVKHLSALRGATQETTPADLWSFRSALVAEVEEPGTLNNQFKRARAALEWWRRAQLVPLLSSDAIADAFKVVPEDMEEIRPLAPREIRDLLTAVARDPEPRFPALVALILLTGMRRGEAEQISWDDCALDVDQACIRLGTWVKTRKARTVDLTVCPAAVDLMRAIRDRSLGDYVVSGQEPLTERQGRRWRDRLQVLSRPWTYRLLRQTAGSYLANAPAIFGGASAYRTARMLGHSVAVSEKHYLGVLPGVPASAKTVEAAMEAEAEFRAIVDRFRSTLTKTEVGPDSTYNSTLEDGAAVRGDC
jgi:integrase